MRLLFTNNLSFFDSFINSFFLGVQPLTEYGYFFLFIIMALTFGFGFIAIIYHNFKEIPDCDRNSSMVRLKFFQLTLISLLLLAATKYKARISDSQAYFASYGNYIFKIHKVQLDTKDIQLIMTDTTTKESIPMRETCTKLTCEKMIRDYIDNYILLTEIIDSIKFDKISLMEFIRYPKEKQFFLFPYRDKETNSKIFFIKKGNTYLSKKVELTPYEDKFGTKYVSRKLVDYNIKSSNIGSEEDILTKFNFKKEIKVASSAIFILTIKEKNNSKLIINHIKETFSDKIKLEKK